MLELYRRLRAANVWLNGSLEFANHRRFLSEAPLTDFEHLTRTGPYAGSKTAFTLGVRLRTAYHELYEAVVASNKHLNFWASGSQRVIETAQYFATAFFGLNWPQTTTLRIVSEAPELGADTLTPGETCWNYYDDSNEQGWNLGAKMLGEFRGPYLEEIQRRFLKENPNFVFHRDEIYDMQEMCGFDTMIHGSSPWCDIFTREEWDSYEYARDLLHFYRSGPGNLFTATMGWLWLNATANLLRDGRSAGPFFFSL